MITTGSTVRFCGQAGKVLMTRSAWSAKNRSDNCVNSDPARVLVQFSDRRRWIRVDELDRK